MKRKPPGNRPTRENPEWKQGTFANARPARELLPDLVGVRAAGELLRPRGRPKTGRARTSVRLRLPPEVLARWKATGPGGQTRMVEALARVL